MAARRSSRLSSLLLHTALPSRPAWQRTLSARGFATAINNKLDNVYDMVIVGGGIAGTALACSLATNPSMKDYRIALIEAMDLSNTNNWAPATGRYSNRVVSLTPASMQFFQKIGVADELYRDRIQPYNCMKVSDGVTNASIEFDTNLLSTSTNPDDLPIAYMIENVHLQHSILKTLQTSQGKGATVDIMQKARVASIRMQERDMKESEDTLDLSDWPIIEMEDGKALQARLLVGADGVNSPVRSFAKIESLGWDYNMHGVVATFKTDPSRKNDTAYQRFLPTGPIAMLPVRLGDGHASMVWSMPPDMAQKVKKIPAQAFCTLVNSAFRLSMEDLDYLRSKIDPTTFEPLCDFDSEYNWRQGVAKHGLGDMELMERELAFPPIVESVDETSRASFPLRMRNSQQYFADRVVLVGDAAHTVHPLAGQGLNQGILDVACLSDILQRGASEGMDIGNLHLLREYASVRYLRNLLMISACDKLHRLYTTDFAPITWIRSLGLSSVNQLDFVKAEIMKYAMGIEQ
ncbi:ubiquinone biosynthesis monooxygenase coq6 [Lichtheimia corymbifera JMRC:FSU:9682]|uniref:Ubiquinone biosynthesis monooxygenase COQ6, mitochondrial n=1 Tax=Lichtheimia corymbifera JMRC:FSU:9682 TaxID=1263082 RepID=A0A068S512_9FUNG|nr:ubiquinone biosynthesis monooxygenase coq6 [Lichtheimia corymbifera JMRC:FSU:9682]